MRARSLRGPRGRGRRRRPCRLEGCGRGRARLHHRRNGKTRREANRIIAAIGPAINHDSYEVGPDFEAELLKSCADNEKFLIRENPDQR
ncbi:MAG TPA: laccase domain-containing protein, partial [Hyphomicrobium sp.]|nr:laccase domain-containing protein [Hyphomicrobium sp.]